MRNYCRFFLASGTYDDGFGNSVVTTNWFESEKQRDDYFSSQPFPNPPAWATYQHVWVLLDKRIVGRLLNATSSGSVIPPEALTPALGYALFSPAGEWFSKRGALSRFFERADQDPTR